MIDMYRLIEHQAFFAGLGEANGYIFRNGEEWIGVIIFHAGQTPELIERFPDRYSAIEWLDSYSCF